MERMAVHYGGGAWERQRSQTRPRAAVASSHRCFRGPSNFVAVTRFAPKPLRSIRRSAESKQVHPASYERRFFGTLYETFDACLLM